MEVAQQETTSSNEDMVLRFGLYSNHMCGYKEWLFDLNE